MKYIHKPTVVEAIQYTGSNSFEIEEWAKGIIYESPVLEPGPDNPSGRYLQIKTLEGWMIANPGDYVIKGIAGEFYSCKPDIFNASYNKVDMNQIHHIWIPGEGQVDLFPDGTAMKEGRLLSPGEAEEYKKMLDTYIALPGCSAANYISKCVL